MKGILFQTFTIHTPKDRDSVRSALRSHIAPKRWFWFGQNSVPFQGGMEGDAFKITRIISYQNSFMPVIHGRIVSTPRGTEVRILMRPYLFVILFLAVWSTPFLTIALSNLLSVIVTKEELNTFPLEMLLFMLLLSNGGFWYDAWKSKKILLELIS